MSSSATKVRAALALHRAQCKEKRAVNFWSERVGNAQYAFPRVKNKNLQPFFFYITMVDARYLFSSLERCRGR